MATYIKGSLIPNATNYVLYEKQSGGEMTSMGLGSQDLFTSTTVTNATGGSSITGYLFGIGRVPANKSLAGVRVLTGLVQKTGTEQIEATTVSGYLYTCEIVPTHEGKGAFISVTNPTRVRAVTKAISESINQNVIIDVVFDEPFINTENKFLMFGYHVDTGNQRRFASPNKSGAEVCAQTDGQTYEPLHVWYSAKTAFSDTEAGLWSSGYDDTKALAYTLLTTGGSSYVEKAQNTSINFDLSSLSLGSGAHTFVVQAKASGYEDSDYSNEVNYTV